MNKWLYLGLSLMNTLAIAGSACTNCASAREIFNGPYLAAGGGYTHQVVDYEYRQRNFTFSSPEFTNTYTATQNNGTYRGVLGYGMTLESLYLGSELSVGKLRGQAKAFPLYSGGPSLVQEEQKVNLVASFLIGATVTDTTLIYGQAGIGAGKYQLSIEDFNSTVVPSTQQQTNWTAEYLLGLGVEQVVMDNLSLRLSYLYEKGARIIGPMASTVNFSGNSLYNTHEHTYVPSDHTVMLDIVWRLDLV